MNIIEFIGFIIVMLAMIILFAKRSWEERQRKKYPEKYEAEQREQEETLRQFLRSLEGDEEELEELTAVAQREPPPPSHEEESVDEFEQQMILEKSKMRGMQRKMFHSPGEKNAYHIKYKKTAISAAKLLRGNLREAVILKEVLGKPKGM